MNLFKKSNLISILKNKKFRSQIIIFLCIGIVLLLIITTFSNKGAEQTTTTYDYVCNLENKLTKTLSKVKGVGNVSVIITVESGNETVLASTTTTKTTSSGTEITQTPILVNGKTIVIKEMLPKIVGVLIVSDNAKNIAVYNALQQATVSLLNINVNQIEILSTN